MLSTSGQKGKIEILDKSQINIDLKEDYLNNSSIE